MFESLGYNAPFRLHDIERPGCTSNHHAPGIAQSRHADNLPSACEVDNSRREGPPGSGLGSAPHRADLAIGPCEHQCTSVTTPDERSNGSACGLSRRKIDAIHLGGHVAKIGDQGLAFLRDRPKVADELGPGKNVVTILCDTGERYISIEKYFNI